MAKQSEEEMRKFLMGYTKGQLVDLYMQKRFECFVAEQEARVAQGALSLVCEELLVAEKRFRSIDAKNRALRKKIDGFRTRAEKALGADTDALGRDGYLALQSTKGGGDE